MWYYNYASQQKQKLDFTLVDGVLLNRTDLRSVANKDGNISFFKTENPTDESFDNDIIFDVEIEGFQAYPSIITQNHKIINNPNYGWISYLGTMTGFVLSFSYDSINPYLELIVDLNAVS